MDTFRKHSFKKIRFLSLRIFAVVQVKSIFLVVVLKRPKEIVNASVQECLDKKGKNDPSNSDSYENLSVCDQTCPS